MDNNTTTSQPLATESFSYSWLANSSSQCQQHQTIFSSSNIHNNQSFLLDETNHNFDFNISISKPHNYSSLVHADKLFSNGLILPQPLDSDEPSSNATACSIIVSSSSSPLSSVNSNIHHTSSSSSFRRMFLGKWSGKLFIPRKIVSKYIKCLVPMKKSIGRSSGTRVDDVNRLTCQVKNNITNASNYNNNYAPKVASPKKEIAAYSSSGWSDIDESSIREAILYCKRSSGLC